MRYSIGPREDKVQGSTARWLTRFIEAVGDRLFREEDARVGRHGWHVQVGHGGLSRTYRDPRFDSLRGCPACHGTGIGEQDHACGRCSGTGRIRLGDPLSPDAGRGR